MTEETKSSNVIVELEQRIVALETGVRYDVNKEAIETIERQQLQTLREIRTALIHEQQQQAQKNGDISIHQPQQESLVESLQVENEVLKKKMMKMEYRIQHLVTNMNVLCDK